MCINSCQSFSLYGRTCTVCILLCWISSIIPLKRTSQMYYHVVYWSAFLWPTGNTWHLRLKWGDLYFARQLQRFRPITGWPCGTDIMAEGMVKKGSSTHYIQEGESRSPAWERSQATDIVPKVTSPWSTQTLPWVALKSIKLIININHHT